MKEFLNKIEHLVSDRTKFPEIKGILKSFFNKLSNNIEGYIGDYPTFIEPVYLESNVKIGDDVLLGPNVYIGANSEIGDYAELSNTIVFDNVKTGENFKFENCIVLKNCNINFNNFNIKNSIIRGSGSSIEELQILKY